MEIEGVDKMENETEEREIGVVDSELKEWTQTMKEWKTKSYLLIEKYTA